MGEVADLGKELNLLKLLKLLKAPGMSIYPAGPGMAKAAQVHEAVEQPKVLTPFTRDYGTGLPEVNG